MYINEKEYGKLKNELKRLQWEKNIMVPWDIRENLNVHPIINKIFSYNDDFRDFAGNLDFVKTKELRFQCINEDFDKLFKIPGMFKDHNYWIKHNTHIEKIVGNFTAFISFPYINFEIFEREAKELGLFWDIYIVNPLLMSYSSAIGVFISLKGVSEYAVNDLNGYVEGKTGYPLLFKYTKEDCDEIKYREHNHSFEEFKKRSIHDNYEYKIMLEKMYDFWHNNDNVSWESLENSYHKYWKNVSFWVINSINIGRLKCADGFRLVNTRTGQSSSVLKELEFDLAFDCYYDGRFLSSEVKLSEEDLKDLKEGNFELQICKQKERVDNG